MRRIIEIIVIDDLFLFNAIIDVVNLRELELSGRQFAWANSLETLTFEKLDRILSCTEWKSKFPHTTVHALSQEISDHTPLLLNTGDSAGRTTPPQFKFELGWFLREGFFDMVKEIWSEAQGGHTPLEKWQAKIRRGRQFLRGWAKNISATNKKEKSQLLDNLNMLDKKAENSPLDQDELNLKHVMNERLANLLREEELKWYQRAKAKNLLEGDANTKYFHLVANGKHRKSRIFRLEQEEGLIQGEKELRDYITKYYKELFGPSKSIPMSLDVVVMISLKSLYRKMKC
jgi:hypothetical protein